jgi:hypothetical protein
VSASLFLEDKVASRNHRVEDESRVIPAVQTSASDQLRVGADGDRRDALRLAGQAGELGCRELCGPREEHLRDEGRYTAPPIGGE